MRLLLISFLSFFSITVSLGEDVVRDETLNSNIENERTISPIKERSPAGLLSLIGLIVLSFSMLEFKVSSRTTSSPSETVIEKKDKKLINNNLIL